MGVTNSKTVLASVEQTTDYVQNAFSSEAKNFARAWPALATRLCKDAFDYDPGEFMTALVGEIFDQGAEAKLGKPSPSKSVLLKDGLPEEAATEISANAYRMALSELSQMFGEVSPSMVADGAGYSGNGDVLFKLTAPFPDKL